MEKEGYSHWRTLAQEYKRVDRIHCSINTALTVTREALAVVGLDLVESRVTFPNPLDPPPERFTFLDKTLMPALDHQLKNLREALAEEVPQGKGEELIRRIHGRNLASTETPDPQIHIQPEVVERSPESLAGIAIWTAFWNAKIIKEFDELQAQAPKVDLRLKSFSFEFSFMPDVDKYNTDEEKLLVFTKLCVAQGLERVANVVLDQLFHRDPALLDETLAIIGEIQVAVEENENISFVLDPKVLARLKQLVPSLDLT